MKPYPIRFDEETVNKIKQFNNNFSEFVRTEVNLKVNPQKERAYFFKKNNGLCKYCGEELNDGFHLDHIVPTSWGGISAEFNLTACCTKCNVVKSDACENKNNDIFNEKEIKLLGNTIKTFNNGYFFAKDVQYNTFLCSEHLDIFPTFFEDFTRKPKAHESFLICYENNIQPIMLIDNKKAIHLFVLIDYCVYCLGKHRYKVYEDMKDGDLFVENKEVFKNLKEKKTKQWGFFPHYTKTNNNKERTKYEQSINSRIIGKWCSSRIA